jgi:hypothetical protein
MASAYTRVVAVAVALSFFINGCATYVPLGPRLASGPTTVRLSLTESGHTEALGSLGSQIVSLEGELRSVGDSIVIMAVSEIGRVAADNQTVPVQTVAVPVRLIERADRKKIMVGRSLLLAAAVTGAVVWIGLQAGHGSVSYRRPAQPPPAGQ